VSDLRRHIDIDKDQI